MKLSDFNSISIKYGDFKIEEVLYNNSRIYSINKYVS